MSPVEHHEHNQDKALLVSVERARAMLGLGRTKLYEFIKDGKLPSKMLGGRRLIPVAALEKLASEGEATQ